MSIIQQFDYSANLGTSLLWQYNQAVQLQSLVNSMQMFFDVNQTEFWQNWYAQVFNLYSPALNQFGATIWSFILGIPLQVNTQPDEITSEAVSLVAVIIGGGPTYTVTGTVSSTTGLGVGESITISGANDVYNGNFTTTAVTDTTFSYIITPALPPAPASGIATFSGAGDKPILIFDQTATGVPVYSTFDTSVFSYNNTSVALTLDQQILILKLRAFQLNNRGSVIQINEFLQHTFAGFQGYEGTCFVLDGGLGGDVMTMTYVFTQTLPAGLQYILANYDILPRPAGVKLNDFEIHLANVFGFDGGYPNYTDTYLPFDNGPFFQTFSPPT